MAPALGFAIGYFTVDQTRTEIQIHDDCQLVAFFAGTFAGLVGLGVTLPLSAVLTRDLPDR